MHDLTPKCGKIRSLACDHLRMCDTEQITESFALHGKVTPHVQCSAGGNSSCLLRLGEAAAPGEAAALFEEARLRPGCA